MFHYISQLKILWLSLVMAMLPCLGVSMAWSAEEDIFDDASFWLDDTPKEQDIDHPDWFKLSFLDLPEDLDEAVGEGKAGIMVYFGQNNCAYCKMLMDVTFGQEDIAAYTQKHFDVLSVNIWGNQEVVDMDGEIITEKELALRKQTQFTPMVIFYGMDGEEALRLKGYHSPYKFRAALEYVADGHYLNTGLQEFMDRADPPNKFEPEEINEEEFFNSPPHMLDRSRFAAEKLMVVFFEQGDCHACDVLHTEHLQNPRILQVLDKFETIQLDIRSNTPVVTPGGERLTAASWARKLGLFYTPTLVFFDENGGEIFRIDSLVRFYRLRGVLEFIASKGYIRQPNFLHWCSEQRKRGKWLL